MRVTILILIDGFLQYDSTYEKTRDIMVTILILIDGFLQFASEIQFNELSINVTILILIDGFLQWYKGKNTDTLFLESQSLF